MRRLLAYVPVVIALIVAFVAGFVPLPYYSLGPGPAREVRPLIHVDGPQTFPSDGHFIMTTVEFRQLTAVGSLLAWIDPGEAVVARDVLYPPGQTAQEEKRTSISQMDESKIDATSVVLRELEGYPGNHGKGSLIRETVPGCSAEGELFPGDLVLSVNDEPVSDAREAGVVIESIPSGDALTFDIRPLGTSKAEDVRLVRRPCGGSQRPLVGVSMTNNFPFEVSISSGDVGGPSAGLMWALGLYDALTPGDLTGGRTIAGTGTIDPEGKVGPIGGIEEKVLGARKAGASELLVPQDNMPAARAVGESRVRLVPVATFDQAVAFLARQSGTAAVPPSPVAGNAP